MLTITKDQALNRWGTLTEALREALFLEINTDFVQKVCERENVPEAKRSEVAGIAGYVLLGFLHPEDLAEELIESLALNQQTAKAIAAAINERIFTPIREDIDKVYNPVTRLQAAVQVQNGNSPKMVFDMVSANSAQASLKPLTPAVPKAPPSPTPSSSPIAAPVSQKPISAVLSSIPATPTKIPPASLGKFAAPSPLTQTGWSKTTASPISPSEPAPIMLHEDAKFTSSEKTTDFHLTRPGSAAEVSMSGVKSQQPIKPAVLELGTLANAPKLTHYTQFQGSAPAPTQPSDRHITEVTSTFVPKTPAPTSMPQAPMPAAPAPIISPQAPSFTVTTFTPKPPAPPQAPQPQQPQSPRPMMPSTQMPTPPQPPKPPAPPQPQGKVVKVNYP